MNTNDILGKYHYEKLSSKHDLSKFSCGVDDRDDFLKSDALKQQEKNLNVTYLAIYEDEILGYASILADSITCKEIDKNIPTKYPDYPAVKIGRLAVDEKYKGMHIGTAILDSICKLIKKMSKRLGIGYITLDAYCSARNFYLKNEFRYMQIHNPKKLKRTSKRNPTTSVAMYKNIEKVEELD